MFLSVLVITGYCCSSGMESSLWDMFLPFGLHTAPRIFNLFAEALHWVFETLHEWNVTHYLDDFLFMFPPNTDITVISLQFDDVLTKFGLTKATEKDSDGCVVMHL